MRWEVHCDSQFAIESEWISRTAPWIRIDGRICTIQTAADRARIPWLYRCCHCQTAPCILNIRDGAQPYKQHMLKNELTASRTRATKVRIIDMPIWAEPTSLILAFAPKKRMRSTANAPVVIKAANPEDKLRKHEPQSGTSPVRKDAPANISANPWRIAKACVTALTKAWGIWKGKSLPTRVLISFKAQKMRFEINVG